MTFNLYKIAQQEFSKEEEVRGMIKAVLFDLDGTLLNRDESVKSFIDHQFEQYKFNPILKEQYMSRFIELDCRGYVSKDQVYRQLADELRVTHIHDEILHNDYFCNFKNHCIPFPELIDMLDELKNASLRLGIITNGGGQFQLDNMKALGIENYFEVILISEWEGIKKPDPEIFRRALLKLNVEPSQSIFVGDHPKNDIWGAKSIGMKSIWKRDPQWDDADADFTINHLEEIPYIIERMNRNGG